LGARVYGSRGSLRFGGATLKRLEQNRYAAILRLVSQRLLAGGNWNNGTNCRSQSRNGNNYRWNTNTNIGGRFTSDLGILSKLLTGLINLAEKQNTKRRIWLASSESESQLNHIMKRHGNLFEQIISMDNLYLAYRQAHKGKAWQKAVKEFDMDIDGNLAIIQQKLVDGFHTSSYKTKTIHEPKKREIYILPFSPDRIVQHALMNILEPIWEKLFIYDSYACRKGKGIHAGSRRTMEFIRQNRYCMQSDVAKFYPSVKHDILFEIIQQKIKCQRTLGIIEDIIYSIGEGQNVPIGNYTSQWFGNLYLNELDQFLKHEYHIKHYIRYCDDFVVFHDDKKFLNELSGDIKDFLKDKLQLVLKKCSIFPVSQGLDFLGYRHFRNYVLLRKSTAKRVLRRLKQLPVLFAKGKITADQFRSSLASTNGWLKWANTYNLQLKLNIGQLQALYDGIQEV
jgi:retron-type reverse transcriptase